MYKRQGSDDETPWSRMTAGSSDADVTESCHFDITCTKEEHKSESDNFCETCMERVVRGNYTSRGTEEYVRWGRRVVTKSLNWLCD